MLSLLSIFCFSVVPLAFSEGSNFRQIKMSASADKVTAGWLRRNGGMGVVITGGSRGVGYAMAKEFLKRGDSVVICGKDRDRLVSDLID